jgi:hypothetical protein
VTPSATFEDNLGIIRLIANLPFYRRFLRPPSTEAPSLHRSYPASSVLRASPPSQSARPVSHELPVDPHRDHRWDFPCCAWSTLPTCRRQYPGRSDRICSLVRFHPLRPSHEWGRVGSRISLFEACSAFTHVTACTLAKSPSDPRHQRLQQFRCPHCCSDFCRAERTSSRANLPPVWTSAFHGAPVSRDLGDSKAGPVRSEQCPKKWLGGCKRGSSDRKNEPSEPCHLRGPCSVHKSLVSTVEEALGCASQRAKSKIQDTVSANTLDKCCSLAR